MATSYASITSSGPGYDLEAQYLQYGYKQLPNPKSTIPFGKQGQPIPDQYQTHSSWQQIYPATHPLSPNMQPFGHFVGTSHKQINQPSYLGINEQIGQSRW